MNERRRNISTALLLNGLPGLILILAGIAVAVISLFADSLDLGGQPGIIGWKQIAGAGAGTLIVILGALILSSLSQGKGSLRKQSGEIPLGIHWDEGGEFYDSGAPRIPFLHELAEVYRYRYLLWNLISRDLKVRYKRSILGLLWAMISPLLTMAVLLVVFTKLFRFQIEHYSIYLLSGLLVWNLFSQGTSNAMRSVLDNSSLRKNIYIPSSVFVFAAIGSALVNLLFALGPLLILSALTGVQVRITWLFLPVPIILTSIFAFAIGLMLAALAVFFADTIHIYQVVLNAYFYLTPILYPASILPVILLRAQQFNPLFHFINSFRDLLMNGILPSPRELVVSAFAAFILAAGAWSIFTRLSDKFVYRT